MEHQALTDAHLERVPDLDRARRASVMAHGVVIKLKEMGLPDDMDAHLSQMCTDLGDLWSAQAAFAEQLEAFLESPGEWNAVGDSLVDLSSTIDHIVHHTKGVAGPMEVITLWAYEKGLSAGD